MWTPQQKVQYVLWLTEFKSVTRVQLHVRTKWNVDSPISKSIHQWERTLKKTGTLVLGMICLVLIAHFTQFFHPLTGNSLGLLCSKSAAYFLLVSYGFFVTSIILLICSVLSYFTASFLPKTAFELTYHVIACVMYLSASLILLCEVVSSNAESDDFKEPGYEGKIAASALGLANSVLYGVSSFFSFQARKQMG
ncbi:MARVEL domain-containing protein [Trichonephila clavipes]|nr:MARVEL domain-containing protein [Trichonephila clavipes]